MAEDEDKPKTRRSAAARKTSTTRRKPAAKSAAAGARVRPAAASADDGGAVTEAVALVEPAREDQQASAAADAESPLDHVPWKRGLTMLAFLVLIWVAQWVLGLSAVVQFLWMAVTGGRNRQIASFGEGLGDWLNRAARFQTGATEDKPFPWRRWGA